MGGAEGERGERGERRRMEMKMSGEERKKGEEA